MPSEWLEQGRALRIKNAATRFGPAGLVIESSADNRRIDAVLTLPQRDKPERVILRLRHPQGRGPVRVMVNDRPLPPERILAQDITIVAPGEPLPEIVRVTADYSVR